MNHVYEINVPKSKFRDAYNAGNVDRLLAVFADEFTDMSAGAPSFFGADSKSVVRSRMTRLRVLVIGGSARDPLKVLGRSCLSAVSAPGSPVADDGPL